MITIGSLVISRRNVIDDGDGCYSAAPIDDPVDGDPSKDIGICRNPGAKCYGHFLIQIDNLATE